MGGATASESSPLLWFSSLVALVGYCCDPPSLLELLLFLVLFSSFRIVWSVLFLFVSRGALFVVLSVALPLSLKLSAIALAFVALPVAFDDMIFSASGVANVSFEYRRSRLVVGV